MRTTSGMERPVLGGASLAIETAAALPGTYAAEILAFTSEITSEAREPRP